MDRSFEAVAPATEPPEGVERGRGKPLTEAERQALLQALLARSDGKKLQHGAVVSVAKEFGVTRHTVTALWKRGMESLRNGAGFMEISSRKKNCGRKMKDYDQQIASISTVPLAQRSTLASTAQAIKVPKTVLFRRLKAGVIISHTNSIKPFLTDANKAAQV